MFKIPKVLSLLLLFFLFAGCRQNIPLKDLNKIEFNYNSVDERGYAHGASGMDYEFCIPRQNSYVRRIQKIEPRVQILEKSKGRIGCNPQQMLCVVSTHDAQWKQKLYKIASLPFIERIAQTVYE